ncbi:MAG: UDP-N-acetylmuramoyl-L-alanine--D-glutamate ligase, partial [Proteobacteria bacterium]|nr:UDP-N-acetylmuramoyl-L-alanine--D-glutamate ligase [Pseudomonadota bacterium]
ADTRAAPPRAPDFSGELHTGAFTPALLESVDLVCISPGLSPLEPVVQSAAAMGIPVLGDVELFAWHVRAQDASRVLAITGTNGKTTVAALTGHLLRAAGIDVEVAGNIGPAALAALMQRVTPPAAWVLELSSYQLETTWSLDPHAAAMLNLSEDHLDRYAGVADYGAAKARVFQGEGTQVLNRDDPRSLAMAIEGRPRVTFGLDAPRSALDFGVVGQMLHEGSLPLLPVAELRIHGAHNVANALAASALARSLGVSREALAQGLRSFEGLAHRLQRIAERRGVAWYDDSKGTNVGATVAALRGLGRPALLIAGGDGKGQDFAPLAPAVSGHARGVLLIGRDAALIERALAASGVPLERCDTLQQAVTRAAQLAQPGDAVLLSPACASFDMFRDYRQRGEIFAQALAALGD